MEPFGHIYMSPPVPTMAWFSITASQSWNDASYPEGKYFRPDGTEETAEEFYAAREQWQKAMDAILREKVAAEAIARQEQSWQNRFRKIMQSLKEW